MGDVTLLGKVICQVEITKYLVQNNFHSGSSCFFYIHGHMLSNFTHVLFAHHSSALCSTNRVQVVLVHLPVLLIFCSMCTAG